MPDEIRFIADYAGWKREKRLAVSDSTSAQAVLSLLSEIRVEVREKAFELTGINVAEIKSFARAQAAGKSGPAALAQLNQPKIRARLREICPDKLLFPFAAALFNGEVLQLLGIKLVFR